GCWQVFTDEITRKVLDRGYILAHFNRTELATDVRSKARDGGLYPFFPKRDFGALAAWAWGFHRCVDALIAMPEVDARRVIATGHSRGGKTALLAGATDERIALTAPNDSGCGGAGSFLCQGPESETLADILRVFPYWFSSKLPAYLRKGRTLPFDQHLVKALVAPRALLATEALGDLWANPTGTHHTHEQAREVYRLLGAEDQIGLCYRPGGHEHALEDWNALLDFADWRLGGSERRRDFWQSPGGTP
ncbi:MAG TPA: acetylxylan esterase, partial [Spirochaetia bacterium]|nr:acetylxylan esterase [Spirochaetia bacterium]